MKNNQIKVDDIQNEPDALDQSMALNQIVLNLLEKKHKEDILTKWIVIISICVNLVIAGVFIAFATQFVPVETEEVSTTTTTVTQEADGDSNINNVQGNQYMDSATHNAGSGN